MSDFEYCNPYEAGVSATGLKKFNDTLAEEHMHIHSYAFMRHGKIIAETYYRPYTPKDKHMLFSLSKSFTSVAVGMAIDEGRLALTDQVISFFPEKLTNAPCVNMQKMTIYDLLTMQTGHETEPFDLVPYDRPDWESAFLHTYVDRKPGTYFVYNTTATYMLSAILKKVTGETVLAYLKPRLLSPLHISEDVWWEENAEGVDEGGIGFNVRLSDLLKFGQFLLQKGKSPDGRQLISPRYLEMASSPLADNSANENPDWKMGYGFQFWRCVPEGVYRADGAFGQYCLIMPAQDMVFVCNSGIRDMQRVLTAIWKNIQPGLDQKKSCNADVYTVPREQELKTAYEDRQEEHIEEHIEDHAENHIENHPEDYAGDGNTKDVTSSERENITKNKTEDATTDRMKDTTASVTGDVTFQNLKQVEHIQNASVIGDVTVVGEKAGTYLLSENPSKIEKIIIPEDGKTITLVIDGNLNVLPLLSDSWQRVRIQTVKSFDRNKMSFFSGIFDKAAVRSFYKDGVLSVNFAYIETPFEDEFRFSFAGDGIRMIRGRNVEFNDSNYTVLGYKSI